MLEHRGSVVAVRIRRSLQGHRLIDIPVGGRKGQRRSGLYGKVRVLAGARAPSDGDGDVRGRRFLQLHLIARVAVLGYAQRGFREHDDVVVGFADVQIRVFMPAGVTAAGSKESERLDIGRRVRVLRRAEGRRLRRRPVREGEGQRKLISWRVRVGVDLRIGVQESRERELLRYAHRDVGGRPRRQPHRNVDRSAFPGTHNVPDGTVGRLSSLSKALAASVLFCSAP